MDTSLGFGTPCMCVTNTLHLSLIFISKILGVFNYINRAFSKMTSKQLCNLCNLCILMTSRHWKYGSILELKPLHLSTKTASMTYRFIQVHPWHLATYRYIHQHPWATKSGISHSVTTGTSWYIFGIQVQPWHLLTSRGNQASYLTSFDNWDIWVHPRHPGTSRYIQVNPGTSINIHGQPSQVSAIQWQLEHLGTSMASRYNPDIYWHPLATKQAISHPVTTRTSGCIQVHPGTSRYIQLQPGTSINIHQHPSTSMGNQASYQPFSDN